MPEWTKPARETLERYFTEVRASLAESGADADEVVSDLGRHIDEEIAGARLAVVTEEDVRHILARIGAPENRTALEKERTRPAENVGERSKARPVRFALLTFGVVLPIIALAFEYFTGMCAALFFDPLPTIWHTLLVAGVPVANFLAWRAARHDFARQRGWLGWLNGFALGIALIYALLYLPLTPFAIPGVIFYGFGLLPLTPLLSLIATLQLRNHVRQIGNGAAGLPGLWRGMGLAGLLLLVLALPTIVAEAGLRMADSSGATTRASGVRWLRALGSEEALLRACYGRPNREMNLYSFGEPVSPETARTIFYRVTGRAFNSVPPPKLYAGRGRWRVLEEEFTWDNDQGGDAVAGRAKGLTLVGSRQDGFVDADAALGYVEWILEFKNVSPLQREARAQIALPAGGVVSRLTLWIDGEEREAAFAGRSEVKTAYKEVVHQRRDPVLVTTCGPDRVLLQCYPVQPNGGLMKCRIGITVPLILTGADQAFLRWPAFLERNFTIGEDFKHSVWIESKAPLRDANNKLTVGQSKSGGFTLRGNMADSELAEEGTVVRIARNGEIRQAWVNDSRSAEPQIIRERMVEAAADLPNRVVLVVDGSRGMTEFYPAISEALTKLPDGVELAVLLAADSVEGIYGLGKTTPALSQKVAGRLRKVVTVGGRDNVPALLRGWDLAADSPNGVIIWIHGPQPVLLDSAEALRQKLERREDHPLLFEIQTRNGPNRIAEKLDGLQSVASIPRLGGLGDDLARLFNNWRGKSIRFTRDRVSRDLPSASVSGKETSLHLARLWARDEVRRLSTSRRFTEAAALSTRYQIRHAHQRRRGAGKQGPVRTRESPPGRTRHGAHRAGTIDLGIMGSGDGHIALCEAASPAEAKLT